MPKDPSPTRLLRAVRFSINPDGSTQGQNNFAATPASSGLARHYEITLGVEGIPEPDTGYLIGIQEIDRLVRDHLLPLIAHACQHAPETEPATMLPDLLGIAQAHCPHPISLIRWALSPYYGVEMTADDAQTRRVLIRQSFEFAAAHRLHTPSLSDEENRAFFGKCNHPSGHGHNYRIEPRVSIPVESLGTINAQLAMQECVNRALIEPLDHTFLNTDCPWFDQSRGGVIPSVENIARVCFERLAPEIEALAGGMRLEGLQAWETEKTSAIYPA